MDDTTAAPVNYATEFVDGYGTVSDECYAELRDHYDWSTVVGVTMLAGYYVFLHHVAAALGLDWRRSSSVEGWRTIGERWLAVVAASPAKHWPPTSRTGETDT